MWEVILMLMVVKIDIKVNQGKSMGQFIFKSWFQYCTLCSHSSLIWSLKNFYIIYSDQWAYSVFCVDTVIVEISFSSKSSHFKPSNFLLKLTIVNDL